MFFGPARQSFKPVDLRRCGPLRGDSRHIALGPFPKFGAFGQGDFSMENKIHFDGHP